MYYVSVAHEASTTTLIDVELKGSLQPPPYALTHDTPSPPTTHSLSLLPSTQVYYLDYQAFYTNTPLGPARQYTVYEATWGGTVAAVAEAEAEAVVEAAGVVVGEKNEQKQEQGAGATALSPSMLPPCDGSSSSSMLQLAGHGEWAEVGGRLRWVDPSVPCVTPIRYARAGGE